MKIAGYAFAILSLAGAVAAVPALADTVYNSGSSAYGTDAWTINYGFLVSDQFTLSSPVTVTGATFDVWTYPGDSLTSVDWSIADTAFGGSFTTAATSGVYDTENGFLFDIYTESFSIASMPLAAGTYWITLGNAVVPPNGDPIFWDENDGTSIGFDSFEGSIGNYDCTNGYGCGLSGGETFTLEGTATTPEPSSFLLLGSGLAGFAGMLRRKLRA